MLNSILPTKFPKFLMLIMITIIMTYSASKILASSWYIILLYLYASSKDEAFWLAFFLVTVDGFMGFLGKYSVVIQIIPGMPALEIAQIYILLSLYKANRLKDKVFIFYKSYLIILFLYLIFMIIWGQLMGFSGELNVYFRIFKVTLPVLLFYTVPRLIPDIRDYERFFNFIFPVLILASMTQIFTLLTGLSPARNLKLNDEQIAEAGFFRIYYNTSATLLGVLGALFFLVSKLKNIFTNIYLYIVLLAAFSIALLSATRGLIISIGLIISLTFYFTRSISIKRIIGFSVLAGLVIFVGYSNRTVKKQINFSYKRFTTMESLAEGDITAKGTLRRLSDRGPRVMKKWAENPVFGWGYSDISRKYGDGHVGNQNLLMTSGIVGFLLLNGFLIYFCYKLLIIYRRLPKTYLLRNTILVFNLFLLGWFLLHSTSSQHFNYGGMPAPMITQAVFFSLGALVYEKSKEVLNGGQI
jgi:hypothetical protein